MNLYIIIDLIGWVGSATILTAYIFNWSVLSFWYIGLNIWGGLCCIINTGYYGAFSSSFTNIIWVGFAISSLLKRRTLKN